MTCFQDEALIIRDMCASDAQRIADAERAAGYGDSPDRFIQRVRDAAAGRSAALVAELGGEPVGYINVYWEAEQGPFAGTGVPGIEDFGVLARCRGRGVGSKLMDAAERLAARRCGRVWLAVGLHHWYGAAQRMYVRRGYVFDGSGVWYAGKPLAPYAPCVNDDDLVLYLIKELK